MSRVEAGLTYNSLTDHHLANFFGRPRQRQHLRQSGLIRRDGEIRSESSLLAESLKRDQKRQAKEAILRSLELRKDDLTRNHQALCLRTIEEIEKIERVRRIRSGRTYGGMSYTELIDCAIVPRSICHRPLSANFINGEEESGTLFYTNNLTRSRRSRSAGFRRSGCCHGDDNLQCNRAPGDKTSTFSLSLSPQTTSDYLPALQRRKSKKRKLRPNGRRERKNAQPLKPKQTSAEEDESRLTMVTMKYYGDNLHLENDQTDPRVDVLVEQQHCGGNTLCVFRDKILPGTEFSFPSYRHPGYPFSLTIYVNGVTDSRLSVCCEYKHKINARLGGKSGHFAVVGVKRGLPCHSCIMKYRKKNRNKNRGRRNSNKESDDSSDSRGDDDDEETAVSSFQGHRNRLLIPVDDEENDRDEEYGKELNRRTADAQSPELDVRSRTPSAKKTRDPYNHFLYDLQVSVEDEDNGNNNNDGGVSRPRHESPNREQQMKSPSQKSSQHSEKSSSESESSDSEEEEEGDDEQDVYSKGSVCSEAIEKVKPKSSRSQRESNQDDEQESESGS